MPLKLSAFPKCYLDLIAGDRTMSVFDWIGPPSNLADNESPRPYGRGL